MMVYRISTRKFARDLSGHGADLYGGRWNSPGTAMLYTSESRALCCVEIAVHTPLGNIPSSYQIVQIEIPDSGITVFNSDLLPNQWNANPHGTITEKIGNSFISEGNHLILQVPSASIEGDSNFLVNPRHVDFRKVKIKSVADFQFDLRLFS